MTDAPFTETHRTPFSPKRMREEATSLVTTDHGRYVGNMLRSAADQIDAAKAEIDRLRQQLVRLCQEQRADVERWNTANAEANAEIDRLQKVIDAYERLAAKRLRDTPFTETHRAIAKLRIEFKPQKAQASPRCAGCGHRQFQHRRYTHGTNRHGSRWVCTVDNCRWTECRGLPEPKATP